MELVEQSLGLNIGPSNVISCSFSQCDLIRCLSLTALPRIQSLSDRQSVETFSTIHNQEMNIQPIYFAKFRKPLCQSNSSTTRFIHSNISQFCSSSVSFRPSWLRTNGFGDRLRVGECDRKQYVCAVQSEISSSVYEEQWLLEPAGDGDWRHIGFKVSMPGPFEISSDKVTVGRVPEKADLVIPVATVSGVHARIEKKGGGLMVTDLDSTNGTFVGEKRLIPGVPVAAPPGSYITFGDTNLAIFRLSKIKNLKPASVPEKSEKTEPVSSTAAENSEKAI